MDAVNFFKVDLTLVLIYTSLLLLWIIILYKDSFGFKAKRGKLPGPLSFPIIGSVIEIAWIGRNTRNDKFCRKLCKKFGPVMQFKAGVQNFVVVEDYDVAKHIFNSEDWCSRFPTTSLFLEIFANHQKVGILFNDGEEYKETRRFSLRCLKEFGFGQLQNMGNVIQDEVEYFISNLEETQQLVDNNNNNNPADDITLHAMFNLPALNVLWKYLCGTRFSTNDLTMTRVVSIIQRASEAASFGTKPLYAFPFLRFVPKLTDQQLLVGTFNEMRNIFQDIINEKKKHKSYKTEPNDFIDMYLKVIDEYKEESSGGKARKDSSYEIYSEEQLVQSCVDMALAGSDTTGNSIEYSILYMLQFPEIQRKVQEEIDTIIGAHRKPTIQDRNKMPYTEATILEILRCANVAALDHRTALFDTELCDAFVPKNTMALLNLSKIHKDERLWDDPEEFRPTRFLNSNMEIINANKLFVFGGGKRLCIGKSMAKATIFIFFTTLLQRYTFEPSVKHPDLSIHAFTGGFTTRPDEFYCIIKQRQNYQLLN